MSKRPIKYRATFPDGSKQTLDLPSDSDHLYQNADVINEQFEGTVFFTVLKQTGARDDQDRMIFDLSDEVAFDDEFMESFIPDSEENDNARAAMPAAASLWDEVLSKPHHGYIPLSELKEGKHPPFVVLSASWVIFVQEKYSQDPPMIWAQRVRGDEQFFIAGPLIAGETDFAHAHDHYHLTNRSSPDATQCDLYSVYIDDDELEDVTSALKEASPVIAQALELKPLRNTGVIPMWIIPAKELGLDDKGIIVRDTSGLTSKLRGYASVEHGILSLTLFGKVKPEQPNMRVIFRNKHLDAVGITQRGAEIAPQYFSPMLRDITSAIIGHEKWPPYERPDTMSRRVLSFAHQLFFGRHNDN